MKLNVTNLSATDPVYLFGGVQLPAGGTVELTNQSPDQVDYLESRVDAGDITVLCTLEDGDDVSLVVALDETPDFAAPGPVDGGFQIKLPNGFDVAIEAVVHLGTYTEAGAINADTATLDNESKGTILDGTGTASIVAKADAEGKFTCEVARAGAGTFYIVSAVRAGSPCLDCEAVDTVVVS